MDKSTYWLDKPGRWCTLPLQVSVDLGSTIASNGIDLLGDAQHGSFYGHKSEKGDTSATSLSHECFPDKYLYLSDPVELRHIEEDSGKGFLHLYLG